MTRPGQPEPIRYARGIRWGTNWKYWVRRLNAVLAVLRVDLALLDNAGLEDFLDQLYAAMYDRPRDRQNKESNFNRIANRKSVLEAQRGLLRGLRDPDPQFHLAEQVLTIAEAPDIGFFSYLESEDLPTSLYMTLAHLLEASGVRRTDMRLCANEKCGHLFVPMRRPKKDTPSFCSTKCANLVAMRNYRKRQAAKRAKAKRKKRK